MRRKVHFPRNPKPYEPEQEHGLPDARDSQENPYGQPFNGQNPYEQGQNPYGENPYGQNPYGRGQDPYREWQNPYGQWQNPYGQGQDPYEQAYKQWQDFYEQAYKQWQNPYGQPGGQERSVENRLPYEEPHGRKGRFRMRTVLKVFLLLAVIGGAVYLFAPETYRSIRFPERHSEIRHKKRKQATASGTLDWENVPYAIENFEQVKNYREDVLSAPKTADFLKEMSAVCVNKGFTEKYMSLVKDPTQENGIKLLGKTTSQSEYKEMKSFNWTGSDDRFPLNPGINLNIDRRTDMTSISLSHCFSSFSKSLKGISKKDLEGKTLAELEKTYGKPTLTSYILSKDSPPLKTFSWTDRDWYNVKVLVSGEKIISIDLYDILVDEVSFFVDIR